MTENMRAMFWRMGESLRRGEPWRPWPSRRLEERPRRAEARPLSTEIVRAVSTCLPGEPATGPSFGVPPSKSRESKRLDMGKKEPWRRGEPSILSKRLTGTCGSSLIRRFRHQPQAMMVQTSKVFKGSSRAAQGRTPPGTLPAKATHQTMVVVVVVVVEVLEGVTVVVEVVVEVEVEVTVVVAVVVVRVRVVVAVVLVSVVVVRVRVPV
mmetsp:Transcript_64111/g.187603  ORF Transcript_64111/g.187603 Transcript_64111/m.187603 type:complete len:209 (+) Transcript_64111:261-887(+)